MDVQDGGKDLPLADRCMRVNLDYSGLHKVSLVVRSICEDFSSVKKLATLRESRLDTLLVLLDLNL